jgi:hypothetical protein
MMQHKNKKCILCRNTCTKKYSTGVSHTFCKFEPVIDKEKKYAEKWRQIRSNDFVSNCPGFQSKGGIK